MKKYFRTRLTSAARFDTIKIRKPVAGTATVWHQKILFQEVTHEKVFALMLALIMVFALVGPTAFADDNVTISL